MTDTRKIVACGMLAGLAVLAGCETFRETKALERKSVDIPILGETPRTPEDHAAAAKLYREEAVKYRGLADRHRTLKAYYSETTRHVLPQMDKHCDRMIKDFESLAEEAETMAAWHEQEAKSGASR